MVYGKDISLEYYFNKVVIDYFIGYVLKYLFLGFVNMCIIFRF